jgi:hypothetical protein
MERAHLARMSFLLFLKNMRAGSTRSNALQRLVFKSGAT